MVFVLAVVAVVVKPVFVVANVAIIVIRGDGSPYYRCRDLSCVDPIHPLVNRVYLAITSSYSVADQVRLQNILHNPTRIIFSDFYHSPKNKGSAG